MSRPQRSQRSQISAAGVSTVTLGCRLNTFDSDLIAQRLRQEERAHDNKPLVVINTCSVTQNALKDGQKAVRKARRENSHARIVVTGCAAQTNPDVFTSMPEVERVISNSEKYHVQRYWTLSDNDKKGAKGSVTRPIIDDPSAVKEQALHMMAAFQRSDFGASGHVPGADQTELRRCRAFVAVQSGCDHACTFCIIPRARGRSWCVDPQAVLRYVRNLVDSGVVEVVLTGVDITSYCVRDEQTNQSSDLADLVVLLLKEVPQLQRLRLSSIDCVEMPPKLLEIFASSHRLLPHVHLSLQSGDDLVLKRMGRRHLSCHAVELCRQLREARPDIVIGADFIVGFPTETEDMFQRTMEHVEACGISLLHVFSYSSRQQTPAARIPAQVDAHTKRDRSARLRELGNRHRGQEMQKWLGKVVNVLFEHSYPPGEKYPDGMVKGHTDHFLPATTTIKMQKTNESAEYLHSAGFPNSLTHNVWPCRVLGYDGNALQVLPLLSEGG